MPPPNIYGRFELNYLPPNASVDNQPTRLPVVLSDDELSDFKQPPINPESQIRLISLLPPKKRPGSNSLDPLRCGIAVHTLDDAPPFEALSYTWGGIHRHLPMAVVGQDEDGQEVEEALRTTPQLLMALRRLRGTQPRLLWVDQLCIDQDNPEEKGPQIQLMADIYRRAERVVIWLGEDDWDIRSGEKDADHIADLVEALGGGFDDATDADIERAGQLVDYQLSYHYEFPALRRARAVRSTLNRPWFLRAWVFQEASLAKELVVQYGHRQFAFKKFHRALHILNAVARRRGQHVATNSLEVGTGGYEMVDIIQQTRMQVLGLAKPNAQTEGFLSKLFQVLRRVDCYDPKDRIFAFLAFQTGEGITSTSDGAKKPAEDIWIFAASRIIAASGSLDIFAAASGGQIDSKRLLPSWVPDWSNPFPLSRPFALPGSGFRAARDIPHQWTPSDSPNKLRVRGKIIDEIGDFIDRGLGMPFSLWKHTVWLATGFDLIVQDAGRQLGRSDRRTKLGDYYEVKRSNLPRDITRTLLADGALSAKQKLRNVHEYARCFSKNEGERAVELRHAWTRERSEEDAALVADYELVEDLVRVAEGKRLFYTPTLQLGMAVVTAQIGDVIAILHGSKTPCILRRVEGGVEGEYRLISQCYLNGWMYGDSPRELYGKGSDENKNPHPHGRWWEEPDDSFVLS